MAQFNAQVQYGVEYINCDRCVCVKDLAWMTCASDFYCSMYIQGFFAISVDFFKAHGHACLVIITGFGNVVLFIQ